jgi:RNA polymerase-binding transcription factor DksA
MDRIQEQETVEREQAIAAARARIAASFDPRDARVDGTCIDCDESIEPARLAALGKTARCAECAHRFEQRHRAGCA